MTIETNQTVIAGGGPDDYLEARHVLLRGSNREIGRAIGEIARTEFDARPLRALDLIRARATRRYFREHYPIHEQRLLGAADAYDIAEGDEMANFVGLPYLMPPLPGCTVAYIPPAKSANGVGLLTRNLDFPLEFGAAPPDDDRLAGASTSQGFKSASRPYLFEVYPDDGYPSLYFAVYDLLSCADGINSEGLTVAMLADDESAARYPAPPITIVSVGLHPLQMTRYLLDNCATAREAQEALYLTKHYAFMIPCHYIIADRHGNSFVWEWSHLQHSEHVVDGGGETQVVSNHPLHQPEPADLSVDSDPGWTHTRLALLADAVASAGDDLTSRQLQDTHAGVRFTRAFAREITGNPKADTVGRTIWHSIYDLDARGIDVSFFLGDNPDGTDRRSPYQSFKLAS